MQDRIPLYPGRVKLTPVSGQENTYDMVRADEPTQVGTALSKANLLKDTTAALYGLDETATPDEVLAWLGKYNEHWWSLYNDQSREGYSETLTNSTSTYKLTRFSDSDSTSVKSNTLYFSKNISIDQSTGAISLVSPESYTMSNDVTNEDFIDRLISLAPVYVTGLILDNEVSADIILVPEGATRNPISGSQSGDVTFAFDFWVGGSAYGNRWSWYTYPYANAGDKAVRVVSSKHWWVNASETTYEHSTDRNAYPDSGTVDSITYSYLGVPFEKFPAMPKLAIGNYAGTGSYGSSNKSSLSFDFAPNVVFLTPYTVTGSSRVSGYGYCMIFTSRMQATMFGDFAGGDKGIYQIYYSRENNTVSWYSTDSPVRQCNAGGYIYNYFAIG